MQPTRRFILKTLAGTGLALPAVMSTVSRAQETNIKEKLRVAFVGAGGIGVHHLDEFSNLISTVKFEPEPDLASKLAITCPCFAEIDPRRWGKIAEMYPQARGYADYREMIDKESKNFDAAVIGIPDHHHYPATMLCMLAGKHVYTQKPLAHTVWEARALTEAAAKHKIATQMGNQGHGLEGWRTVVEWIHTGAIGTVKEVHSWTNRPTWPQPIARPEFEDPIPSGFDWDLWLGPAPKRPFKQNVYHPFNWRGWCDFGNGALGDMGAHTMDGMFWALDSFNPIAIEPIAMTPMGPENETFPAASSIRWEFPDHNERPAFTAYWYDGGLRPARPAGLETTRALPATGNLFIGTDGTILVSGDYGNTSRLLPASLQKAIGKPKPILPRSPGNYAEWVAAAKGIKPLEYCGARFAYAGPVCETILLGNVALRAQRRLEWDTKSLTVANEKSANRWINKEYRKGWEPAATTPPETPSA